MEDASVQSLRRHIAGLLTDGHAHVTFEQAVKGFSFTRAGERPPGFEHTAWQLLEHLRIAQWDILEFSRDANHVSPDFPDGYWPRSEAPAGEAEWEQSLARFRSDLAEMGALVKDPSTDLFARIPHGDGQTILREALLMADHNAYHLGQLIDLRRQLGIWPA
jgi:hypothetical protein